MRRDVAANRSRLVATAEDVRAQHGTRAPREDVARVAGIDPATFYRWFPNKEAHWSAKC